MNSIEADSSGASKAATTTSAQPLDTTADTQAERDEREARERRATQDAAREQAREVGAADTPAVSTSIGGGGTPRRLLLICLDGGTPELAIGAWRTQLRTMHMITDRGTRGRLASSIPWSSTPAWLSLLTGQEPGRLGIYGSHPRPNRSYAMPATLRSLDITEPRLWDLLGASGRHIGVIGAPQTLPVPPVRGHLIAENLADGTLATYPPELAQQVAGWIEDDPPIPSSARDDLDLAIGKIYAHTERRFRLARRLLARNSYDCFVVFDDGIAAVQRLLWHTLDVTHPRYVSNHPFADAISTFYRFVDEQVADLLELIDDSTIVAVVSACGAQSLDGELALNDWLVEQGELTLHRRPSEPTAIERCEIDWGRTRAWAGDDGAIYLNVVGREPRGVVPLTEIEQAIAGLRERLRGLAPPGHPPDEAPAIETYRPAELYSTARGVPPDLLLICRRPGWRPNALAGNRQVWLSSQAGRLDAASESQTGFFAIYDPLAPADGHEVTGATVYDVVPTLLALLGEPIAPRLRGHTLL